MRTLATVLISLMTMLMASGCSPDQRIIDSAKERQAAEGSNSNIAPSVSSFEKDVNAMRNADFKFIVVFRRKDGKVMDADDKAFIVKSASQANRRSLSDGEKAVIIGSNFPFQTTDFKALNERFVMENYSKPDSGDLSVTTGPGNR